jgi:hypothetical protein
MTGTERSAEEIQQSVSEQASQTDHGSGDEYADPATPDEFPGHEPPGTEAYAAEGVDAEDPVVEPGPLPGDRG